MTELHYLTMTDAAEALRRRETSSVDLTRAAFERIGALDSEIHAFLTLTEDAAMEQARRADQLLARGEAGPANRHSGGDQGRHLHARRPHDCRLEDPGAVRPPVRRQRDDTPRRSRGRHARQDQHGRVRHGFQRRELGLRSDAQPLVARPRPRRVLVRLGRRCGRGHGLLRPRLGHRRLDPAASGPLRRRGNEADLRARLSLRSHRFWLVAGSDRPVRPVRARRRPRLPGDLRLRPARLHLRSHGGAGHQELARSRPEGPPRRRAARVLRRGDGSGRARGCRSPP